MQTSEAFRLERLTSSALPALSAGGAPADGAERGWLQLGRRLRLQGGVQDGLDELLEGDAGGLGGEGEGGGLGEAWDGLYVEDPGDAFGEDGVHPGEAGAAQDFVGGERRLLDAGGVLGGISAGMAKSVAPGVYLASKL